MAGEEGAALRAKGDSHGYIRARGVDEALADLAEILQTEPAGYQTNALMARAKRAGCGPLGRPVPRWDWRNDDLSFRAW